VVLIRDWAGLATIVELFSYGISALPAVAKLTLDRFAAPLADPIGLCAHRLTVEFREQLPGCVRVRVADPDFGPRFSVRHIAASHNKVLISNDRLDAAIIEQTLDQFNLEKHWR
jgi:hypothetical protein